MMDTSRLPGVADARDIKMSEKDFHDHVAQPGPPEGGDGKPTSFAEYIHWATLRRRDVVFTYTFPPLFMLGLDMQLDAMTEDEAFTTPGVTPKRIDTWRDLSRWKRGFLSGGLKRVAFKAANLLFFLVGVATAGLGMWATGTDLKEVVAAGAASSFGCAAPV
ncbi:hypothetical protein B0H13DRAFT_2354109 [Mycena leptocephala]|nr:hypothetical protein B0H13DRAFT_2354109 [Mycena leptocephala]